MKFIVAQKVTGAERKVICSVIAAVIGEQVKYAGMPSMSYHIGEWIVEKSGVVRSPEIEFTDVELIKPVIEALKEAGYTSEGDLNIILSVEAHVGGTLRNLCNLISSKGKLLAKALGRENEAIPAALVEDINSAEIETIEDFMRVYNTGIEAGRYVNSGDLWLDHISNEIWLCFFNATLNFDEIVAYITLAYKLNELAISQKHIYPRQKLAENECYTMRCLLLRLGFIGEEYKISRKVLLSRVEGNKAHKTVSSFVI